MISSYIHCLLNITKRTRHFDWWKILITAVTWTAKHCNQTLQQGVVKRIMKNNSNGHADSINMKEENCSLCLFIKTWEFFRLLLECDWCQLGCWDCFDMILYEIITATILVKRYVSYTYGDLASFTMSWRRTINWCTEVLEQAKSSFRVQHCVSNNSQLKSMKSTFLLCNLSPSNKHYRQADAELGMWVARFCHHYYY